MMMPQDSSIVQSYNFSGHGFPLFSSMIFRRGESIKREPALGSESVERDYPSGAEKGVAKGKGEKIEKVKPGNRTHPKSSEG